MAAPAHDLRLLRKLRSLSWIAEIATGQPSDYPKGGQVQFGPVPLFGRAELSEGLVAHEGVACLIGEGVSGRLLTAG